MKNKTGPLIYVFLFLFLISSLYYMTKDRLLYDENIKGQITVDKSFKPSKTYTDLELNIMILNTIFVEKNQKFIKEVKALNFMVPFYTKQELEDVTFLFKKMMEDKKIYESEYNKLMHTLELLSKKYMFESIKEIDKKNKKP